MDIIFTNGRLERICNEEARAKRELGPAGGKKLRTRLADLGAAARVTDLVAGRPHPLSGDRAGQFAVDLDGGRRLVFEPAMDPVPTRQDGSIEWKDVTRVRVVYVGDYHD